MNAEKLLEKAMSNEMTQEEIDVFENIGVSSTIYYKGFGSDLIKAYAYEAIASAMGKDADEIPYFEDLEDIIQKGQFSKLDQEMLQKAHMLINK